MQAKRVTPQDRDRALARVASTTRGVALLAALGTVVFAALAATTPLAGHASRTTSTATSSVATRSAAAATTAAHSTTRTAAATTATATAGAAVQAPTSSSQAPVAASGGS